MDLSQYKQSKGFVAVFGERPFRPMPGETHSEMRGRQMSYQQRIRDWDEVQPADLPPNLEDLLVHYEIGIGRAVPFTSIQRPGLYVIFPHYDAYMDPRRLDNRSATSVLIDAQADYILKVGSLPPERLVPGNPGLWAINEAKRAEEAAVLEE